MFKSIDDETMRSLICFIIFSFSVSLSPLLGEEYLFADIPWGTSHESTLKRLKEKYEIVRADEGLGIIFSGTMAGKFFFGLANTKKDLSIITISFVSNSKEDEMGLSWSSAKHFYNKLASNLESKYGIPFTTEKFTAPFYDGDGYEDQAFAKGKIVWSKLWPNDLDKAALLTLSISDFIMQKGIMSVNLNYTSPKYKEDSEKEETEELNDL